MDNIIVLKVGSPNGVRIVSQEVSKDGGVKLILTHNSYSPWLGEQSGKSVAIVVEDEPITRWRIGERFAVIDLNEKGFSGRWCVPATLEAVYWQDGEIEWHE